MYPSLYLYISVLYPVNLYYKDYYTVLLISLLTSILHTLYRLSTSTLDVIYSHSIHQIQSSRSIESYTVNIQFLFYSTSSHTLCIIQLEQYKLLYTQLTTYDHALSIYTTSYVVPYLTEYTSYLYLYNSIPYIVILSTPYIYIPVSSILVPIYILQIEVISIYQISAK